MSRRTMPITTLALLLIALGVAAAFLGQAILASLLFLIGISSIILFQPRFLLLQAWNDIRRQGRRAFLILIGVAVVSASISTALLVNDSLHDYVDRSGNAALGPVDMTIGNKEGYSDRYYNTSELQPLLLDLATNIGPAYPVMYGKAPVVGGGLIGFAPDVTFLGAYDDTVQHFGGFTTTDGAYIGSELQGDDVLINRAVLASIPTSVGSYIFLHAGNVTVPLHVIGIAAEKGLGGFSADSATIFCSMTVANIVCSASWKFDYILVDAGGKDVLQASTAAGVLLNSTYAQLDLVVYDESATERQIAQHDYSIPLMALGSVGGFSMLAGIMIISGFITIADEGRDKESRILRSLGLRNKDLRSLRMTECMICAIPGVIIGISAAVMFLFILFGADAGIGQVFDPGLVLRAETLALAALSVLGCTVLATTIISGRADRGAKRIVPRKMGGTVLPLSLLAIAVLAMAYAYLTENAGLGVAIFTVLLVGLGLWERLRHSLTYWSVAAVAVGATWIYAIENDWFHGDVLVVQLLLFSISLLLCLALAASLLLARSSPGILSLFRRMRRTTASRYLSWKYIDRESTRRTIVVISIASLFLITSLSTSLLAMAKSNIDEQFQEEVAGFDAVVLRSDLGQTKADIWGMVNQTDGVLWSANISSVTSIYSSSQKVILDNSSGSSMSYSIVSLDPSMAVNFGMRLMRYNEDVFRSEQDVWRGVAENSTYAIVDADLVQGYSDLLRPEQQVDVGSTVRIINATGVGQDVVIMGITQQRFLHAIFVGTELMSSFLDVSEPSLFAVNYRPGLDPQVQSSMLRQVVFPADLMVVDIGSTKAWIDSSIDQWAMVFDALLIATSVSLTAGLIAQMLHVSQLREKESNVLRALGMRRKSRNGSIVRELAVPATAGFIIGMAVAYILAYISWLVFLRPSGLSYRIGLWDVLAGNILLLVIILLTAYLAMDLFRSKERNEMG